MPRSLVWGRKGASEREPLSFVFRLRSFGFSVDTRAELSAVEKQVYHTSVQVILEQAAVLRVPFAALSPSCVFSKLLLFVKLRCHGRGTECDFFCKSYASIFRFDSFVNDIREGNNFKIPLKRAYSRIESVQHPAGAVVLCFVRGATLLRNNLVFALPQREQTLVQYT